MSFWADKRVLVTGGRGFLGLHVCDALLAAGLPKAQLSAPSSQLVDLREKTSCEQEVRGVDVVIHLAARVGGIGLHARAAGAVLHDTALMGLQVMEAARQA